MRKTRILFYVKPLTFVGVIDPQKKQYIATIQSDYMDGLFKAYNREIDMQELRQLLKIAQRIMINNRFIERS